MSWTFDGTNAHEIFSFSFRRLSRPGVLHLHGYVSSKNDKPAPRNLLVTEWDYQERYLGVDHHSRLYVEALDLTYASNAILFVGVGMQEEDLNRLLRISVATAADRFDREIFAILPTKRDLRGEDDRPVLAAIAHRYLRRYGVRVIWYSHGKSDQTQKLCQCLREIAEMRERWWRGWIWLPPLRAPRFSTAEEITTECRRSSADRDQYWPENYLGNKTVELIEQKKINIVSRHFITVAGPQWGLEAAKKEWHVICQSIKERRTVENVSRIGAVVIGGRRGSGRGALLEALVRDGTLAANLAETCLGREITHVDLFLGSTHFSSEFNSIADAVADFLEIHCYNNVEKPKSTSTVSWHTRLQKMIRVQDDFKIAFKENRAAVVVISGMQRLVDNRGRIVGNDVEYFFRTIRNLASSPQTTVILIVIGRTDLWQIDNIQIFGNLSSNIQAGKDNKGGNVENEVGKALALRHDIVHWHRLESEIWESVTDLEKDLTGCGDKAGQLFQIFKHSGYHRQSMAMLEATLRNGPKGIDAADLSRLHSLLHRKGLIDQAETIAEFLIEANVRSIYIQRADQRVVIEEVVFHMFNVLALVPAPVEGKTLSEIIKFLMTHGIAKMECDDALIALVLDRMLSSMMIYEFFPAEETLWRH